MSGFPYDPFADAGEYLPAYAKEVAAAFASVDPASFRKGAAMLEEAAARNATIFTCGNGGSAAIANHMVCDHTKGTRADTDLLPRVHSLVANIEINTAIANDLAYDQVFSYQLQSYASPGDVLVAVSSSGNSPNIVNALLWAREHGVSSIAMTGFKGGKARELADVALYVEAQNYGVVEDVHQALMHALAQFLRQKHFRDPGLIAASAF